MYIFFGSVDLTTLLTVHIHLICKKGIFLFLTLMALLAMELLLFLFSLCFLGKVSKNE